MKKIVATILGIAVVLGAGVALWIALDSNPAAATVGGVKISASQLTKGVNEIIAERKTVSTTNMQLAIGSSLTAEELNFYVISTLLEGLGKADNIKVTDAQVASNEASTLKQAGSAANLKSAEVAQGIASSEFPAYVREVLYLQALDTLAIKHGATSANSSTALQGMVRDFANKVGVTVNPKYGSWDATNVSVVPPTGTK